MAAQKAALSTGKPRSRPLVLVVEDEVLIRLAVGQALRDIGIAAIEARDADEAMSVIHAGIVPDVLFTDVRMPGQIDGLELAALLESMFPDMLVFISSAYFARADLKFGVNFMGKPLDPALVARTIRTALARPPSSNE